MTTLALNAAELTEVRALLRGHVPTLEVRAFGSRVSGSARKTSDLDLVLMTEVPLDLGRLAELRDAFSESDLPFKVDFVDWAATARSFRQIIEQAFFVVQAPEGRGAA